MGLDMFLKGRRSVWQCAPAVKEQLIQLFPDVGDRDVLELTIEAGYWRKANAIHQWFVRECQNGEDDCGSYPVSLAKLAELREVCLEVLAEPERATELLPTQSGFFFGSTEYGPGYLGDLENTVDIVDYCLGLDDGVWDFSYQSSW